MKKIQSNKLMAALVTGALLLLLQNLEAARAASTKEFRAPFRGVSVSINRHFNGDIFTPTGKFANEFATDRRSAAELR